MKTMMSNRVKKVVGAIGLVAVLALCSFLFRIGPASLLRGSDICGSVDNEIRAEEQIGTVLWESYGTNWRLHVSSPTDSGNYNQVINSLIDLYQSDQRVYDIAIGHHQCFSATKSAFARTQETSTALTIKNLKTWVNTGRIFDRDYYSKYYSFFDDSTPTPTTTFHGTSI